MKKTATDNHVEKDSTRQKRHVNVRKKIVHLRLFKHSIMFTNRVIFKPKNR